MRFDSFYHVGTGVYASSYANGGFLLGTSQQYNAMNDKFNAKNANSVYTDSGIVRPLSLNVNYVVKC